VTYDLNIKEAVIAEYIAGAKLQLIGERYRVCPQTVTNWLKAAGVPRRRVGGQPGRRRKFRHGIRLASNHELLGPPQKEKPKKPGRKRIEIDIEFMLDAYASDCSVEGLAEEFGVSIHTIRSRLYEEGAIGR
jgi:hypothetical protein